MVFQGFLGAQRDMGPAKCPWPPGWEGLARRNLSADGQWVFTSQLQAVTGGLPHAEGTAYLLEVATPPLLPVHHVVEDGDHDVPQVGLWNQGHLQEGANQSWDEVKLVLP